MEFPSLARGELLEITSVLLNESPLVSRSCYKLGLLHGDGLEVGHRFSLSVQVNISFI
jgi:hypothetical protein